MSTEKLVTIMEWDGHTWPADGVFSDLWKCQGCGRLYGGATTGKPPFRCLCQPGQVWTANLIATPVAVPASAPLDEVVERELRVYLWLGHGHSMTGLYGDDGEMQCGACAPMWDYKRAPLAEVIRQARKAREEVNLAALLSAQQAAASAPQPLDLFRQKVRIALTYVSKIIVEADSYPMEHSANAMRTLLTNAFIAGMDAERDRLRAAPAVPEGPREDEKADDLTRVGPPVPCVAPAGSTAEQVQGVQSSPAPKRFQSCQCPAAPGEDCPLTMEECEARTADYVGLPWFAARLRRVWDGFVRESLNGVVCSIPDSGLNTQPHRTWCVRCQRRYMELLALVNMLDQRQAVAALERDALLFQLEHDEFEDIPEHSTYPELRLSAVKAPHCSGRVDSGNGTLLACVLAAGHEGHHEAGS